MSLQVHIKYQPITHKNHDVEVPEDLYKIEHDHYILQIVGLPVGHEFGTPLIHEAQVECDDSHHIQRRAHQRQILRPGITRFVEQVVIVIDHVPNH